MTEVKILELYNLLSRSSCWFNPSEFDGLLMKTISWWVENIIMTANYLNSGELVEEPSVISTDVNVEKTSKEVVVELFRYLDEKSEWDEDDIFKKKFRLTLLDEISRKIISVAKDLKYLIELENAELSKNGGNVYMNDVGDMCVILLRNGEREYHEFSESFIKIYRTDPKDDLSKLKFTPTIPPDEGIYYYLYSVTEDYPRRSVSIQLSKKEATFLKRRISEETEKFITSVYPF